MGLLESRLAEAQTKLEYADERNFRCQQGRVEELRALIGLEQTAEAVIEAERSPRRSPSFD